MTSHDSLALDLRWACQRISRRVRFEGTHEIAPHQFSVLARLDDERTPRELAEMERVSPPSMTKTVNCLAERGLVERRPHPVDGRQILIRRTPAGDALVERTRAQRDTWMSSHLEQLDADELAILRAAAPILAKVASA